MINATLPDALRLSGLQRFCNLLNLHYFVGRIRRLCRIRQEQSALCQQSEPLLLGSGFFLPEYLTGNSITLILRTRTLFLNDSVSLHVRERLS
ncbi:hypothetical protein RCT36_02730, partial [Escherichia marmotae]|nr:hypothetical protein [Escherichia marmotae]